MSNHQDALTKQAMELALAQCAGIHDGYTWADAVQDLHEIESLKDAKAFTPVDYLDGLDLDSFFNHVDVDACAIRIELQKAYELGRSKPHDDLTFAKLQGFYERLTEGDSAGRTHETDADWNEAYDAGMNEAERLQQDSTPGTTADMDDAVRGFLMLLSGGGPITYEMARKHCARYHGPRILDSWPPYALEGQGHIPKAAQSDLLYRMMTAARRQAKED